MARANLNGIEIDYEATGAGPAVLLSHGYSATRRMWDDQHRALGDRYRVISWSMRGHGATESPADPARYSSPLTIADMKTLLGHLGVERAVIGGLSLGGYVSLGFALEHPQMTRALVICDSGPGYRSADAREAWNARARERAVSLETRGLEALGQSREVQESASLHRSAQGLAHAARGMLAQEGSRVMDGLAGIRVPARLSSRGRGAAFRRRTANPSGNRATVLRERPPSGWRNGQSFDLRSLPSSDEVGRSGVLRWGSGVGRCPGHGYQFPRCLWGVRRYVGGGPLARAEPSQNGAGRHGTTRAAVPNGWLSGLSRNHLGAAQGPGPDVGHRRPALP